MYVYIQNCALAELELMLPLSWNTQVKHFFPCRLLKQVVIWGRFWAQNMLRFESMHVFLRKQGRTPLYLVLCRLVNVV